MTYKKAYNYLKELARTHPKIFKLGKSYHLVSVTNTDDYAETSEAFVDHLICNSIRFHNNQLPIVKADNTSVNL